MKQSERPRTTVAPSPHRTVGVASQSGRTPTLRWGLLQQQRSAGRALNLVLVLTLILTCIAAAACRSSQMSSDITAERGTVQSPRPELAYPYRGTDQEPGNGLNTQMFGNPGLALSGEGGVVHEDFYVANPLGGAISVNPNDEIWVIVKPAEAGPNRASGR